MIFKINPSLLIPDFMCIYIICIFKNLHNLHYLYLHKLCITIRVLEVKVITLHAEIYILPIHFQLC